MKKSILVSLLSTVVLLSVLLTGCGGPDPIKSGGMPQEAKDRMKKSEDQRKPGGN